MTGNPNLFDRKLLRVRRNRAARADVLPDFLLRRVAEDIADRVSFMRRRFETALDLGCAHGLVGAEIERLPCVGCVVYADEHPALLARTPGTTRVVCEAEWLPFAENSLDLVVSGLSLQNLNDVPGALAQIHRALEPDGLFLASLIGGETLHELRSSLTQAEAELRGGAGIRLPPFGDVRDYGTLLGRAGFTLPVADLDRVTVSYDHVIEVMHDLRGMGGTNVISVRAKRPLTREIIALAEAFWRRDHSDEQGRLKATFDIVTLTGWKHHASQQTPLRPGSARARLADALGTDERSAGETAPTRGEKS